MCGRYRPDIERLRARPRRAARPEAQRGPPGRQEAAITVAELGEFGLIAAIARLLPPDRGPLLGVGDDAAVISAPDRRVVATTDLLVEGRHFRRDWSGPEDIGVKAAAQNLADVAAMGAVPTALLVGLAAPGELAVDWALDLVRGLVAECERGGAVIAGDQHGHFVACDGAEAYVAEAEIGRNGVDDHPFAVERNAPEVEEDWYLHELNDCGREFPNPIGQEAEHQSSFCGDVHRHN